jgi:hypothetical protein
MGLASTYINIDQHIHDTTVTHIKGIKMPRKKIAAANTESPEVAQDVVETMPTYYEYTAPDATVVLLDRYEWTRGLGITDKNVKKAQAARHREVAKGFATVEEA